jgi:hypothetical protein
MKAAENGLGQNATAFGDPVAIRRWRAPLVGRIGKYGLQFRVGDNHGVTRVEVLLFVSKRHQRVELRCRTGRPDARG